MNESIIYQIGLNKLTKKSGKFNFRCPICKDSQTNLRKKRGWIYTYKGEFWYNCYNCGYAKPFKSFLKDHYPHLYSEYIKNEIFDKHDKHIEDHANELPKIEFEYIDDLPSIFSLDKEHFARKYIENRKIPLNHWKHIYFAFNYQLWINNKMPGKFISTPHQDARIVLPIYNIHKKIVGAQGRSIDKFAKLRYITILFNENELNVSGLERVNKNEMIYVTEGYIDSLFLPNAISMNSSSVDVDQLLQISNKDNFVFVYDNERRNKEIKQRMLNIAKKGFKIALWPKSVYTWGKDINKMVENGYSVENIKTTIDNNIYKGFEAESLIRLI